MKIYQMNEDDVVIANSKIDALARLNDVYNIMIDDTYTWDDFADDYAPDMQVVCDLGNKSMHVKSKISGHIELLDFESVLAQLSDEEAFYFSSAS
tara:strand:- start:140 stop:424 length:285 start_codon:yes stop_codon:yes gene_type:complete